MSRVTKTTACTGAALALALTLTGCNAGGKATDSSTPASASSSSLVPIPDAPSASVSSSASGSSTSGAPSAASGEFKPVTSKAPQSEEEGKAKAFEAVQLRYKVLTKIMQAWDPHQVGQLAVAVDGPYLDQEQAALKEAMEQHKQKYEGESKPELISGIAGPLVAADGALTNYSSVTLKVCEDNSRVKVTDEQGAAVDTGMPRYVVDYSARWYPETEQWKVTSRTLPQEEEKC